MTILEKGFMLGCPFTGIGWKSTRKLYEHQKQLIFSRGNTLVVVNARVKYLRSGSSKSTILLGTSKPVLRSRSSSVGNTRKAISTSAPIKYKDKRKSWRVHKKKPISQSPIPSPQSALLTSSEPISMDNVFPKYEYPKDEYLLGSVGYPKAKERIRNKERSKSKEKAKEKQKRDSKEKERDKYKFNDKKRNVRLMNMFPQNKLKNHRTTGSQPDISSIRMQNMANSPNTSPPNSSPKSLSTSIIIHNNHNYNFDQQAPGQYAISDNIIDSETYPSPAEIKAILYALEAKDNEIKAKDAQIEARIKLSSALEKEIASKNQELDAMKSLLMIRSEQLKEALEKIRLLETCMNNNDISSDEISSVGDDETK